MNKQEAIQKADNFLEDLKKIQDKYNMTIGSDTGDIYLIYKSSEQNKVWDSISLGWEGDGTSIKVTES